MERELGIGLSAHPFVKSKPKPRTSCSQALQYEMHRYHPNRRAPENFHHSDLRSLPFTSHAIVIYQSQVLLRTHLSLRSHGVIHTDPFPGLTFGSQTSHAWILRLFVSVSLRVRYVLAPASNYQHFFKDNIFDLDSSMSYTDHHRDGKKESPCGGCVVGFNQRPGDTSGQHRRPRTHKKICIVVSCLGSQ